MPMPSSASDQIALAVIAPVVDRERAEAAKKKEEAWHWGPVGSHQETAVESATAIIKKHLDQSGMIDRQACLVALEEQRQAFSRSSYDSDGYASATIKAIQNPFEERTREPSGLIFIWFKRWWTARKSRVLKQQSPWSD